MASLIINDKGHRKYLTQEERERFLRQSKKAKQEVYIFCRILMETGCRISEALSLGRDHIDLSQKCIYIETLKQRRRGAFRYIPVSNVSLMELMRLHDTRQRLDNGYQDRLWNWSRMTGYRHIVSTMTLAGIEGSHASPKGLRHGFAVAALQAGVPMNLVQRWLGHSHWNTTAIYADVIDAEERRFAELVWFDSQSKATGHSTSPPQSVTNSVSLASHLVGNGRYRSHQ